MSTTANTITALLDNILVRGMRVLRERVMYTTTINRDYSRDAKQVGKTVDVPYSTAKTAASVTPAETPPAPAATTPGTVQITLDQWKHTDFHLSDNDVKYMNASKAFIPLTVQESFRAMASNVNQYIAALYTGVYGFTGTPGTTPFGAGVEIQSATNARKVLNSQLCPRDNRWGILDDEAEAAALNLADFHHANRAGDDGPIIEGDLGKKLGIHWLADDDVKTHTTGTCTDGAVNGAHSKDATARTDTLSVVSTAGGTYTAGDIITIAGHDQTYAVTAAVTLAAGVAGDVSIAPGLQAALSGTELVTKKASHTVNLAYNRDWAAIAMRAPDQNLNVLREMLGEARTQSLVNPYRIAADPLTGLVCRIEIIREYKQTVFDLDWLYGAKLIDARKAMRIAG